MGRAGRRSLIGRSCGPLPTAAPPLAGAGGAAGFGGWHRARGDVTAIETIAGLASLNVTKSK